MPHQMFISLVHLPKLLRSSTDQRCVFLKLTSAQCEAGFVSAQIVLIFCSCLEVQGSAAGCVYPTGQHAFRACYELDLVYSVSERFKTIVTYWIFRSGCVSLPLFSLLHEWELFLLPAVVTSVEFCVQLGENNSLACNTQGAWFVYSALPLLCLLVRKRYVCLLYTDRS